MTGWRGKIRSSAVYALGKRFYRSIWFFPVLLAVPLIILTIMQLSGSSIGTYHEIVYGPTVKDADVHLNEPRPIRSDEWLVNTQATIAQSAASFPLVNHNIGNGENMSIIVDVPYKDWSMIFKPHNLAFFVLPLANAFAFKWWIMGYLLIVSCYFFVLALLPKRRLLAAGIGVALFFSAFVQWWYLYGTLGSLYYPLFIITVTIHLCRQKELWKKIALGVIIAYLLVCFALILYPPFQIACGLVGAAFLAGYALENYTHWGRRELLRNLAVVAGSCLVAGLITGVFVATRMDAVKAASHTVYPGQRSIHSGGPLPTHILGSHLGHQFLSDKRTAHYLIDNKSVSNQSETSNFLLLAPFLFLPSLHIIRRSRRTGRREWVLLALNALLIIFAMEMFITQFTPLSRLLLLDKVGADRLLIGAGLLNICLVVQLMYSMIRAKYTFPWRPAVAYGVLIFGVELAVSFHAHSFPFFISSRGAILLSVPLPFIVYLLLRRRFTAAALFYLLFSLYTAFGTNPLYHSLAVISKDPVNVAVRQAAGNSSKRWISDGGYLENIPAMQGKPSLSGVYDYPQLAIWQIIPQANAQTYNRYAHVGFQLSDDPAAKTSLALITPDSFVVKTTACSDFLHQENVGFILTPVVLHSSCLKTIRTISYPATTLYIYALQ